MKLIKMKSAKKNEKEYEGKPNSTALPKPQAKAEERRIEPPRKAKAKAPSNQGWSQRQGLRQKGRDKGRPKAMATAKAHPTRDKDTPKR